MQIKDWFKSKPYWLNGGITLTILYIVLVLPLFITNREFWGDGLSFALVFPVLVVMFLLDRIFGPKSIFDLGSFWGGDHSTITGIIIGYLILILIIFLLGALIGFIIGKIKYKNSIIVIKNN